MTEVVRWWFDDQRRTAIVVKLTKASAHLVWLNGSRGVVYTVRPLTDKMNELIYDKAGKPYPAKRAARKYLDMGKRLGISKRAKAALKVLL